MPKANEWFVYMIRCCDNTLYTGVTTNVSRRFNEHNAQGSKTAKYLRGKHPLKLIYQLQVANKSAALKIEHKIKALSKQDKELIAAGMSTSINN